VDCDGDYDVDAADAVSVLTLFPDRLSLVKSFDNIDSPFSLMAPLAAKS